MAENSISHLSKDLWDKKALLSVRNLKTYYDLGKGRVIKAVENLSFDVYARETLGIIGESGSGKSTVSRALIRLVGNPGYIAGGEVLWKGRDLAHLSERQMLHLRGKEIGLIFQDPTTSLNPLLSIGDQLLETVQVHLRLTRKEALQRVLDTLELVGIHEGEAVFRRYSCDYSAGFRQRVMIALAIVCQPDLVIADEPTTMLGATIQSQILDALRKLQQKLDMAIILITHDFGAVSEVSDRILVMYGGYAMEYAPKRDFLLNPKNPYTLGLINSVPVIEARHTRRLQTIPGFPPDMLHLPSGCPFHPRCSYAQETCLKEMPPFIEVSPEHWCACHYPLQEAESVARQVAISLNELPEAKV
jgi:oligopeptide/dipeptide ABC transporter ATP-binding protein